MIEKLSDEKIKEIANEMTSDNTVPVFKAGIIQGLIKARNYYNAQIDAQAKTMEELWEIYSNVSLNEKAIAFEAEKRKNEILPWTAFSKTIAFYLAAGGRIKE